MERWKNRIYIGLCGRCGKDNISIKSESSCDKCLARERVR